MKTENKTENEKRLEHLEKMYRLHKFLQQVRYPDMTAGYMNRFFII